MERSKEREEEVGQEKRNGRKSENGQSEGRRKGCEGKKRGSKGGLIVTEKEKKSRENLN